MRWLALVAVLAGCLKEKVSFCENGAFCPEPLVCTERTEAPFCGTAAEVDPCVGQPEEAACALPGDVQGYCETGRCQICDANTAACAYDTWVRMPSGTSVDLYAIYVAGPRDVYAAGKGGVVIHWDGRAWTAMPSPEAGDIRALAGAGGKLYAAAATSMYRFDGTAWTSELAAPNPILAIWGAAPDAFFAAGFRATVGRSTTGAWTYVENPLGLGGPPSLNGLWASSPTDVLAVGSGGTVMHWTGASWAQETTTGGHILLGVGGPNAVGRVAGGAGTPVWLRAQGTTWTAVQLPAEIKDQAVALRGAWATGASAFAVGDMGKIVRAIDDTFVMMPSATNTTLNAIGGSGNDVFAVGNGGVVLRYRIP